MHAVYGRGRAVRSSFLKLFVIVHTKHKGGFWRCIHSGTHLCFQAPKKPDQLGINAPHTIKTYADTPKVVSVLMASWQNSVCFVLPMVKFSIHQSWCTFIYLHKILMEALQIETILMSKERFQRWRKRKIMYLQKENVTYGSKDKFDIEDDVIVEILSSQRKLWTPGWTAFSGANGDPSEQTNKQLFPGLLQILLLQLKIPNISHENISIEECCQCCLFFIA